jgi:hypothetical protein
MIFQKIKHFAKETHKNADNTRGILQMQKGS